MKTQKIAAGYYTAKCETTLDGIKKECTAEVCRVEGNSSWYIRMETAEGLALLDGGDWIDTKAEAVKALEEACRLGFKWVSGIGACVNVK